ncbi:MAG: hypothetical protein AAFY71_05520 [Bacteroidota bacterium]
MKKITLLLSLLLFALWGRAQDPILNASLLLENGLHPGLKVGAEYPLAGGMVSKRGKRENKRLVRSLFLGGNVGVYNHTNHHIGLLSTLELGYRRTKAHRRGNFFAVKAGGGYLQRYATLTTYALDQGGNLEEVNGNQGQALFTLTYMTGQELRYHNGSPFGWFIAPSIWLLTPYNFSFAPNLALEIGVTYSLGQSK